MWKMRMKSTGESTTVKIIVAKIVAVVESTSARIILTTSGMESTALGTKELITSSIVSAPP